jgi:uncharacterized protein (TIGR01732 family)
MCCGESSNNKDMTPVKRTGNTSFVIVVVLYILLAIIIGSCII